MVSIYYDLEYDKAHRLAAKVLGPPPLICPTCGNSAEKREGGRRRMQLSYVGPKTERHAYDPTGKDYIWECISCNMHRTDRTASRKGIPRSEETKAKIRAATTGKKKHSRTGKPLGFALKGITRSEEFRAKVSASMKRLRQQQREARTK